MEIDHNEIPEVETTLTHDIRRERDRLIKIVSSISPSARTLKQIDGTGGKVSIADIIAYQIGWGKCLIRWYEAGIREEASEMPGDGFTNWNYTAIAKYFYEKYSYDSAEQQLRVFEEVVCRILEIIQTECKTENLDRLGVWAWCTLRSGKPWPLSKWIQVNTVAPYKRAVLLIKKAKI
ncbi:MAG: ClbS/DfsB family four-helix bundle protein [Parachlamydiaceae bacterium]